MLDWLIQILYMVVAEVSENDSKVGERERTEGEPRKFDDGPCLRILVLLLIVLLIILLIGVSFGFSVRFK